jgi:hypothetical protein
MKKLDGLLNQVQQDIQRRADQCFTISSASDLLSNLGRHYSQGAITI